MKLHKALALTLRHHGMTDLFGILGTGNMFMVSDAIDNGVHYVAATREDGAVLMADGYARVTGKVGFAVVTYGPSLANSPNALIEGVRNRTSMVVLVGDTPTNVRGHLHDIDQGLLLEGTGVGFQDVTHPSKAVEDLEIAIRRCLIEQRPIVFNVPKDYQTEEVEEPRWSWTLPKPQQIVPDADRVDEALGLLASARRPLVVIGHGARSKEAQAEVGALADKLGALIATTVKAKGALAEHPFNVGICGDHSSLLGQKHIAMADCVIAFGAGLNQYTRAALPTVPWIHVDASRDRLGTAYPVAVELLGDTFQTAKILSEWLDSIEHTPSSSFRTDSLREELEHWDPSSEYVDNSSPAGVDMRSVCLELDKALPNDRVVAIDGGHFMSAPLQYLRVNDPASFLLCSNFGSIGLGLSAAIGAAYARRDTTTVLVLGDGGWMMSALELWTAVREGLDLVVVIMNDNAYGMEWHHMKLAGLDPSPSQLEWPSFVELSRALGATAASVTSVAGVAEALDARTEATPLVIDVQVDPSARLGILD